MKYKRSVSQNGIMIEVKEPITFTSGLSASRFKKVTEPGYRRRRTVWIALDMGNRRCRIPETHMRSVGFDVISEPEVGR